MDGAYALGVVLTIIGGIALAVQSGINSTLGIASGSKAFSSVISFGMGVVVCLIYFAIDTQGLHHPLLSAAGIRSAPWWSWIGGALGAYYVIIVIIFAQKLGAGTLVAIFVCAQLITSIILDLTGLVGFSRRVFSWQRWVGAALMVAGVLLVTYYPGETVAAVQQRLQQAKQDASHSRHLTVELGNVVGVAPAAAAGVDATARVLAASAVHLERSRRGTAVDLLVKLESKV
jgi:transporter family-2 protein